MPFSGLTLEGVLGEQSITAYLAEFKMCSLYATFQQEYSNSYQEFIVRKLTVF